MTEHDPDSEQTRSPIAGAAQGLFLGPAMLAALGGWICVLAGVAAVSAAVVSAWVLPALVLGAGLLSAAVGFLIWRVSILTQALNLSRQARERLAASDTLTGTLNHSAFMEVSEREFARCHRYGQPVSVMLLDIDFFKRINAGYGHSVGDDVLRAFVGTLAKGLRNVDVMGRLGGKDFAILLPNTDGAAAAMLADRLREKVAGIVVRTTGEVDVRFTASIGVTGMTEQDSSLQQMLGRSERALRQAKNSGRNRVEFDSGTALVGVTAEAAASATGAVGA